MTEPVATFIMLSNYFHDVATATILALSVSLYIVVSQLERAPDSTIVIIMVRYLRKVLIVCLVWLVAGALVRILGFHSYELPEAKAKGIILALFAKHITAFILILVGAIFWQKMIRRFKEITNQ